MKSIIITADSNVSFIGKIIQNQIIRASNEYNFIDQSCQVQVIWRQWLPDEEYSKLKSPIDRNKVIDEILQDEADLKIDAASKLRKINRFLKIEDYNNKLEEFSEFDSIKILPKYDFLNGSTGENKMLEFILDI